MLTKILLTLSLITGISTIAVANSDKFYALQVNEIDSTSSKIIAQTPLPELENIAKAIAVKVYAGDDKGSGILIAQKNNTYTVITNAHVTDRGDIYTIETSDGIKHNAVISDRQGTENDLAILKFNSNNAYQVAKLGDSKAIAKDETVIAAGFPYDRDNLLITQGKISLLLDKPLAKGYQIGFSNKTVQGMSGGLLLNAKGEVIGVLGKGKGALLKDSYNYQDGTSPTPESIEQMKDAGFSIPIANIAEVEPELASLLPGNNPDVAQNAQTKAAEKPEYTGIVGKVDAIAEQITVRIDNTQNNTNGSGVIVAKQGNTYYGITAKHVLCDGISKPHCEPNGTHEIVTPDGETHKLNYQTVEANQAWLDVAIFAFESSNDYALATVSKYKPENQIIFVSGFSSENTGSDGNPMRLITGGKLQEDSVEELITRDTSSLAKSLGKGQDSLVYTNVSYRGMSGGAVLDSEGRLIGINTGSEQELYFDNEGNYSELNLGLSLGEAISDVFGYLQTNKPELQKSWFNVATNPSKQLSNLEKKSFVSQLFSLKQPQDDADITAWMNYGNQLWRYGKNTEAIKAFEKVISISPEFDKAFYGMGLAYFRQDKWQQVLKVLTKATEINPNPYYYWRYMSHSYKNLKEYDKALSSNSRAIVQNQNKKNKDFILYLEKGTILLEAERYSKALAAYNKAVSINPYHSWIYTNRGLVYSELKQYKEALADFNQAIKINPQSASSYSNRGIVYSELKQHKEALADFNQAIKIDPQLAKAYQNKGVTYALLKQYKQAVINCNQAITINPQNAECYYILGVVYEKLKQYKRSVINCNQAITINPKFALAYFRRGRVYSKLKQYKLALADYDQALNIDPQYVDAYIQQGLIYAQFKKQEQSLAKFNQAIKVDSQSAFAYLSRGMVYTQLTQVEQALADFNRAIEINPQYAEAYENKALLYAYLRNKPEAKKNLEEAARLYKMQNNSRKYQEISQILQAVYK